MMFDGGTILTVYLAVNVLLLLAFALFMTGRYLMSSRIVDATFTQQRRFCEMVLLATFVAPIIVLALSAVLSSPLIMPRLGLLGNSASPLDDWPIIQALAAAGQAGTPGAVQAAAQPAGTHWWQGIDYVGAIGWLMIAGVLLVLLRFLASLWHLRNVVADSVPLRRLGRVSILVSDQATVPF